MRRRLNEISNRYEADADRMMRLGRFIDDYEIERDKIYLLCNHVEAEVMVDYDNNKEYYISDFSCGQGSMFNQTEADEALSELKSVFSAVKEFNNMRQHTP